jgi:hypothetical protein
MRTAFCTIELDWNTAQTRRWDFDGKKSGSIDQAEGIQFINLEGRNFCKNYSWLINGK